MEPEELIALQGMFSANNVTVAEVADEQRRVVTEMSKADQMTAVSTFASMLVSPHLQANAYRLEALVHISVIYADGRQHPSSQSIQKAFKQFGNGVCGRLEDPAEDLFSTSVHCRNGNFTVFEGVREGNGFYLQRVLDVLEEMPDWEPFASFRRSVFALLALSEAVASRSGVLPRTMGESQPLSALPRQVANQFGRMRNWVCFTANDPELRSIDLADLGPFIFSLGRKELLQQSFGHTSLQRYPILKFGDMLCLALPTAVGVSLTWYLLGNLAALRKISRFEKTLARNYWDLLSSTPLVLASKRLPLELQQRGDLRVSSLLSEVDTGRYFHLVLINESLDDLEEGGFTNPSPASGEQSRLAMQQVATASKAASSRDGFRDGITLIVYCGLGRASVFLGEAAPENWRIEFMAVHDAITMAWMDRFRVIDLWRILDSKSAIDAAGITLINPNGMLNLFAWADDLNGHLLPHSQIPESFRSDEAKRIVFVDQNAVLSLRHKVHSYRHTIVALNEDGVYRRVHRISESTFKDDLEAPLYIDGDALQQDQLRATYIAQSRFWWIEIAAIPTEDRHEIFEHWRMLYTWLMRVAPVLEVIYANELPRVIAIKVSFQKIIVSGAKAHQIPSAEELGLAFAVSVDHARGVIAIEVGEAFDRALASSDNIAERALVEAMVMGISKLSGLTIEPAAKLEAVSKICTSNHARSRHIMPAQNFRDMVRARSGDPILMHLMDDAMARVGLAFRAQPDVSNEITGVTECTTFLNRVVRYALQELCALLKLFNRDLFVQAVLENHESAAIHREQWRRTAHACIALHGNSSIPVITRQIAEMTNCSVASRILIEAAICECPVTEGARPGALDLSRAMAKAMFAFHLGGWSDAVHWGAIAPRVRITPLGDVHIDHTFMNTIYQPFAQAGGERELRQEVESYERKYRELETTSSVAELLDPKFLRAWEQEYGVAPDVLRRFIDEMENIGVECNSLWFVRRKSELVSALASCAGREPKHMISTIDLLLLPYRPAWMKTPSGFRDKDWHPWRFRRRLSLVRRPLIQLEDAPDPRIIVAPALLREATYILFRSFHSGETPDYQVISTPMRQWLGHTNHVERTAFNRSVAAKMAELGWKCEPDYRITKLLGFSLSRDYGDVDALAWHPESGRILAMECKDLNFHKTMGEVAEQLSDFHGVVRLDGKRDLLRKHLDRLVVMDENKSRIVERLGLKSEIDIQGYIVFKNPVPMQFAWEQMELKIKLLLFGELETLRIPPKMTVPSEGR